jgi:prolyl 4-hydroxylase
MRTKPNQPASMSSIIQVFAFFVPSILVALVPLVFKIPPVSIIKLSYEEVSAKTSFEALAEQYQIACPEHGYRTRVFSFDPLIIYIENWVTQEEAKYLLHIAEPLYERSPVSTGVNLKGYDNEIRSSMSAVVLDDPIVRCIELRSVAFQGHTSLNHLEDLQVVKYGVSDHFRAHYDWWQGAPNPRVSSFFVYLACDDVDGSACIGGATGFPRLRKNVTSEWHEFVDIGPLVGGTDFKPIVGNAVFWRNLHEDGTGHEGVWHAGMPVKKGRKVGMNILTREKSFW